MLNRLHAVIAIALALEAPAFAQAAQRQATGPQPLPRANFIADMDAEFRKMDADKNGQLTATEIEQFQRIQLLAQARARNQRTFAQLDADRNGQLSPAEFAKLAAPGQIPGAQAMLGRMDGNRDRQVSLVEHRAGTLANFDRLDTDKNGIVTPAEMKAGGITGR
jgi:hypothetical protein